MKFGKLVVVAGALMLAACSSDKSSVSAPETLGVIGTWQGEPVADEMFGTSKPSMMVDHDRITVFNECLHTGKSVKVDVTVPGSVTGNAITFNESKSNTVSGCTARADKGTYAYEIKDGKLLLTLLNGNKIVYGSKSPVVKAAPAPAPAPKQEASAEDTFSFPI